MLIVVVGGCTEAKEEGCLTSIEVLDVDKLLHTGEEVHFNTIENVLKVPRRGPAVWSRNDCIYVAGGCSGPGQHVDSVEKITLKKDKFESEILESQKVEGASCFAFCEIEVSLVLKYLKTLFP